MNILYTLNDAFVPQVAAGITSICENNKDVDDITFYLMSLNIKKENEDKLEEYVSSYGRKIKFIELNDMQNFFKFKIDTSGWNPIVLARLLLDELIPEDVERLIYLDGDTIVRGSLAKMWNTNMGDEAVGACIEPTCTISRKASLGLKNMPYHNAGVLLVDMNNWRKNQVGKQIIDYYTAHEGKLFANDQDAINGSLKGHIVRLSSKYNYCNSFDFYSYKFLSKLVDYDFMTKEEYNEVKANPIIIHYLGEERPWRIGNHHRFRKDYDKYLSMTPWSGENYESGWRLYFVIWDTFNFVMKPFSALRYKIIDALIPKFLAHRAKKNKK